MASMISIANKGPFRIKVRAPRGAWALIFWAMCQSASAHDVAAPNAAQKILLQSADFRTMLRTGKISEAQYAHELKNLMELSMAVDATRLPPGDLQYLNNYRRLAWLYSGLPVAAQSPDLETRFIRSYTLRLIPLVERASTLVGLYGDSIHELHNSNYWKNDSAHNIWENAAPYRWFGPQWGYMAEHATPAGLRIIKSAARLSVDVNVALFDIRNLVPEIPINHLDDADYADLPGFLHRMYEFARRHAFAFFGSEVDEFMLERHPFLGLQNDIIAAKGRNCSSLLDLL